MNNGQAKNYIEKLLNANGQYIVKSNNGSEAIGWYNTNNSNFKSDDAYANKIANDILNNRW